MFLKNFHINDFDYELPPELIAQTPCEKRENSKMLVMNRKMRANKTIEHKHFFDIVDFLGENDVLVLNNTKVIPARIFAEKSDTGAQIEIFLLKKLDDKTYECLIKPSKRVSAGMMLSCRSGFNPTINDVGLKPDLLNVIAEICDKLDGKWVVKFNCEGEFSKILPQIGNVPLPPYIERKMTNEDVERYQTVYAQKEGSVAAPTAGLHFTDEILAKLKAKGVQIAYVTLNVGLGTFRPVKCDNILEHKMDSESFEITRENAEIIEKARTEKKNIVAVGTTTVRTLETTMAKHGKIVPIQDESTLFIYPGYEFKIVNKLLTNFHLPKSTLIMLVSAFAGKDFVFEAYHAAIKNKYRFYSYGDCTFIF